jgi:hypothetical protein
MEQGRKAPRIDRDRDAVPGFGPVTRGPVNGTVRLIHPMAVRRRLQVSVKGGEFDETADA